MTRWERPHGTDGMMITSAVLAAVSGIGLVATTWWLAVPLDTLTPRRFAGHVVTYAFLLFWLVFSWRDLRSGVFVNDGGVLVRGFWHTRYLPWPEVAGFESRPLHRRGAVTGNEAIWVVSRTGETIETAVQKDTGNRGALRKKTGRILGGEDYDAALRTLWRRLESAAAAEAPGTVTDGPGTTAEPPTDRPR